MKKSEIYQRAILSVVNDKEVMPSAKLEILRELFERESVELYAELAKAKKED